jgi:hypothetical protein
MTCSSQISGKEELEAFESCLREEEELQETHEAFSCHSSSDQEIEPFKGWQEELQEGQDRNSLACDKNPEELPNPKEYYDRGYTDGVKSCEWDIFQKYNQGYQDGIRVGKELGAKEMVEKLKELRKKG